MLQSVGGGADVAGEIGGIAAKVTLVGEEPHRPYDRPPLSKQVLVGEWDHERVALPAGARGLPQSVSLARPQHCARCCPKVSNPKAVASAPHMVFAGSLLAEACRPSPLFDQAQHSVAPAAVSWVPTVSSV